MNNTIYTHVFNCLFEYIFFCFQLLLFLGTSLVKMSLKHIRYIDVYIFLLVEQALHC